MEQHTIDKDIAATIKRHFDETYEPTWHCIVGKDFGTHHPLARNLSNDEFQNDLIKVELPV